MLCHWPMAIIFFFFFISPKSQSIYVYILDQPWPWTTFPNVMWFSPRIDVPSKTNMSELIFQIHTSNICFKKYPYIYFFSFFSFFQHFATLSLNAKLWTKHVFCLWLDNRHCWNGNVSPFSPFNEDARVYTGLTTLILCHCNILHCLFNWRS